MRRVSGVVVDHGADGKREDVWHGGWPAGRDGYVAGSAAGGGA